MAGAYDLALRDGTVLHDIRLRDKSPLGILVLHQNGVTFVDYSKIPVPDLYTFGFDEALYKAALPASGKVEQSPAQPVPSYRPERLYRTNPAPATPTPAPAASTIRTLSTLAASAVNASRSQCAATTKKGYRCSRMAQAGRSYCYQH